MEASCSHKRFGPSPSTMSLVDDDEMEEELIDMWFSNKDEDEYGDRDDNHDYEL